MTPVHVGEHWLPGGPAVMCRDGAWGFGAWCDAGSGWHVLPLVLGGQKEQKTGTLPEERALWCRLNLQA